MKFLDFIIHNWYIAVVLFFLISGFVKKRAGAERAPKQAMPPFGGGGGAGWGRNEPAPGRTAAKPPAARAEQSQAAAQKRADVLAAAPAASNRNRIGGDLMEADFWADTPAKSGRSGDQDRSQSRPLGMGGKDNRQTIETEQLAQGIMWAEILGPPRSRRPFRK
jgi:hypothetical protein